MKLSTCILSFILTCFLTESEAQKEITPTQFWNTYSHINPAVTGLNYRHEANVLAEPEYGYHPNPLSIFVNYSLKINALHGGGGVSYQYDYDDKFHVNTLLAHYAFHIPLGKSILSVGISGGVKEAGFRINSPLLNSYETFLNSKNYKMVFSSNAGMVFHRNRFNVGLSVTQINQPVLEDDDDIDTHFDYNLPRSYWLFMDYTFPIAEKIDLCPRIQIFADEEFSDREDFYRISLMTIIGKKIWFGFNHRYGWAGIMAGYDFREKFRIGYSFDYELNNDKLHSIHSVVLSFLLK